MQTYQFTAQIERDTETGLYIGIVPNLPGAHTQGATLDELHQNLKEVIELCLEELTDEELKNLPEFIGVQQISVAV
ncbi:MAG: type II toxin-antitoxin system HicB family antitoxin [Anaerolineales bacterium]|nr:type II toxin-antitoxin system HicB family antitoxin [Anaerolineales bacterium]